MHADGHIVFSFDNRININEVVCAIYTVSLRTNHILRLPRVSNLEVIRLEHTTLNLSYFFLFCRLIYLLQMMEYLLEIMLLYFLLDYFNKFCYFIIGTFVAEEHTFLQENLRKHLVLVHISLTLI